MKGVLIIRVPSIWGVSSLVVLDQNFFLQNSPCFSQSELQTGYDTILCGIIIYNATRLGLIMLYSRVGVYVVLCMVVLGVQNSVSSA